MVDPIPSWPGAVVALDIGDVFVRTAPAPAGAEPALFVHGLGGSSRNWTDLMDLLSRPVPGRPVPSSAVPGGAGPGSAASGGAVLGGAGPGSAVSGGLGPGDGVPGDGVPGGAVSGGPVPGDGAPGGAGPVLACEALDLPGFGYSPVSASGDYSMAACASAVIELIEKRGNWPVHLVGNSLGGAVCTRVAARRPDLVATLTLVSPALPDLRPRLLPLRVAAVSVPGIGPWAMRRLEAVPAEQRTAGTVRELYADPGLLHPDRFREEVAEVVRRDGLGYQAEVLIASARALVIEYARRGPGTLWRDAGRVTAPTLVIHGSHDRLVNPALAARAARAFRSAHVVVLPRIGHVAMLERPDLVARLMRELIVNARPGPPAARELNQVPN